jgi:hypothetical protein
MVRETSKHKLESIGKEDFMAFFVLLSPTFVWHDKGKSQNPQ